MDEKFEDLLDAARDGDRRAFGEIFKRLNPILVSFLSAMDAANAEDIASDTWITAIGHLASFNGGEGDLRAWIFTIARRKLIDLSRASYRRLSDPIDPLQMEIESKDWNPERSVVEAMSVKELAGYIVRYLTPQQAEVVLLGAIAGLRAIEIAEVIGKSPGAVRMLQHKALRRLERSAMPLSVVSE
ncbi:MAG TPA: sigma-70 family RNA polymerase sigma factor [Acidimicrobiales bacterium]|nr:sigma-70 family RNA polymerase sigma factor [Acidimicrobiales bacterium]